MTDGWGISCKIVLRRMPLDLTDEKSTLVQVMAWCCQAPSLMSQCWPRFISPYGVTRPPWVKVMVCCFFGAKCKKDLTPLLMHWSYIFLALTYQLIVCWDLFQGNLYPNTKRFSQENSFDKVVHKMLIILFRSQCVNAKFSVKCVLSSLYLYDLHIYLYLYGVNIYEHIFHFSLKWTLNNRDLISSHREDDETKDILIELGIP